MTFMEHSQQDDCECVRFQNGPRLYKLVPNRGVSSEVGSLSETSLSRCRVLDNFWFLGSDFSSSGLNMSVSEAQTEPHSLSLLRAKLVLVELISTTLEWPRSKVSVCQSCQTREISKFLT